MERRAVEVFIPAVNKKYDMLLPRTMKIGMAAGLMAKLVSEQEQVSIKPENLLLGVIDSEKLLEDNVTLDGANITDGTTLILV